MCEGDVVRFWRGLLLLDVVLLGFGCDWSLGGSVANVRDPPA